MASAFPNGSTFAIATTLASPVTVSGITNANPGVATATAHGYSDGGILLLNMPSRLDQRVVRVDNSSTNAFDLEGVDTTSTAQYPSGFGVGTAQLASDFVSLSQVTDVTSSGGEQQFNQWTYLEDGRQRQRPTFKNARALSVTLDYDPSLAWHAALISADQAGTVYVIRATLPSGAVIYWSMYVSFDGEPTFDINQNQQVTLSLSFAAPNSTRYAA
jgi:hypothetical protein